LELTAGPQPDIGQLARSNHDRKPDAGRAPQTLVDLHVIEIGFGTV
jgi:hypothetical protein